jgi:hypothetical protein
MCGGVRGEAPPLHHGRLGRAGPSGLVRPGKARVRGASVRRNTRDASTPCCARAPHGRMMNCEGVWRTPPLPLPPHLPQVGGLGDVVTGLARSCMARGHAVTVIMPFYSSLPQDQVGVCVGGG